MSAISTGSNPNRGLLDKRLGDLSAERRRYFEFVVRRIDEGGAFEMRENLAFLVLAYACEDVGVNLPAREFVGILSNYLDRDGRWIKRMMYSREFITDQASVGDQIATRFKAAVAECLLDAVRDGQLEPPERKPIVFAWPDYDFDLANFPYGDEDEDDL